MAKYTLGSGISQFKGSRGGSVFQRSGSTFSIRMRRKPRFQRTVRTSRSRVAFNHVQSNIHNLTPSEITAFENNAPDFELTDSLGNNYVLSPTALFSSQNINLAQSQEDLNFTSQAPVTPPNLVSTTVTADATAMDFGFTLGIGNVPADWIFIYYLTRSYGHLPSPSDLLNQFEFIRRSPGQSASVNMYSEWVERFGSDLAIAGRGLGLKLANLHIPSGQLIQRVNIGLIMN